MTIREAVNYLAKFKRDNIQRTTLDDKMLEYYIAYMNGYSIGKAYNYNVPLCVVRFIITLKGKENKNAIHS